jgi:hypothetical protein
VPVKNRLFSDTEDGRPFWKQPAWQISAAFFAFMLCAGVFIALSGEPDAEAGTASPPVDTGPLSAGVPSGDSRPEGCQTDDDDQKAPVRPPRDLRWEPLNGGKVPLSASAGPRITNDLVMWCFAHTPMGAVMAANVIPRQMSGDGWEDATDQQVVPGMGRDLFEAMRSSLPSTPEQYVSTSLAGFFLVSYAPTEATVRLLLQQGETYGVTDYTVAWEGGDWKLLPSKVGDLHTEVVRVRSDAGFVKWKL